MKKMIDHDTLKEMINDENQFENMKEYIKNHHSPDEFKQVMDIIRESRVEYLLIGKLNIDEEKLIKTKKKIIKLSPQSKEYPLKSVLFREHDGKYKAETLFNQYHDSILKEGYAVGFDYGRKFFVEDIQNGRFSKEDIMKMTEKEIHEYCDEAREEI